MALPIFYVLCYLVKLLTHLHGGRIFCLPFVYNASPVGPDGVKRLIQKGVKKELGADYDIKHFNPSYKPLGPAPVHSARFGFI